MRGRLTSPARTSYAIRRGLEGSQRVGLSGMFINNYTKNTAINTLSDVTIGPLVQTASRENADPNPWHQLSDYVADHHSSTQYSVLFNNYSPKAK